MWLFIHLIYIVEFRGRILVFVQCGFEYPTFSRGARLITGDAATDSEEQHGSQFDLREGLFRMTGTDLTRIDGIDVMTAMTIISEAGWDMSKWKTEDHFVSWLRLCPDNRISGNKVIGKGRLPTNNPITIALKMAATTLNAVEQWKYQPTLLNGQPIAVDMEVTVTFKLGS